MLSVDAPPPERPARSLVLLIVALRTYEPVMAAIAAVSGWHAVSVRGWPVAVIILLRLGVAVLAWVCASAVSRRDPTARPLAVIVFGLSGVIQVTAATTPWFPSNRPPDDVPLVVAALVCYYGAWLTFVVRTHRLPRHDDDDAVLQ